MCLTFISANEVVLFGRLHIKKDLEGWSKLGFPCNRLLQKDCDVEPERDLQLTTSACMLGTILAVRWCGLFQRIPL